MIPTEIALRKRQSMDIFVGERKWKRFAKKGGNWRIYMQVLSVRNLEGEHRPNLGFSQPQAGESGQPRNEVL